MSTELNNSQILLNYLQENLNRFSPIKLNVIKVTEQTSMLATDPGNEQIYFAEIAPANGENYTDYEPLINTRKLNDDIQELDIAQEDSVLTIEQYIGLNSSVLLPITTLV